MSNYDYEKLFNGIQGYKKYTQDNFPFKQTNYKGELNPVSTGHPGAVSDTYSRIIDGELVEQFVKVGAGNNDWESFSAKTTTPSRELVEITESSGSVELGDYVTALDNDKTGTDYIWVGDVAQANLFGAPHDGQILNLFFPTSSVYPKTINATNGITFYKSDGETSVEIPEGGHVFNFEFSESLNRWVIQRAGDFIGTVGTSPDVCVLTPTADIDTYWENGASFTSVIYDNSIAPSGAFYTDQAYNEATLKPTASFNPSSYRPEKMFIEISSNSGYPDFDGSFYVTTDLPVNPEDSTIIGQADFSSEPIPSGTTCYLVEIDLDWTSIPSGEDLAYIRIDPTYLELNIHWIYFDEPYPVGLG